MDGCRTVEKVIIFPVYEMETGKISGSHFYRNYPGIPVYAKKISGSFHFQNGNFYPEKWKP